MQKMNLLANIDNSVDENVIGRIGGNIPDYFTDKISEIEGLKFYTTFQHPEKPTYISIFVPEEYDTLVDHNIYPDCSVKVFVHPNTDESNNENYTINYIKKSKIIGYKQSGVDEFGFITKTEKPNLIQDEEYYYERLEQDGYEFLLQVDEDFYPDDLIDGDYIFGYGALYLYENKNDESIVAGFWQYS